MNIAVLKSYQNKTMSEYNPIVINWAGWAKRAGLSFSIVNLGVPWALRPNSPVLLRCCPKRVLFFFFTRELPHKLMWRPVFTCSLPVGAILPSCSHQLHHCMCNLENSYICMMRNCLSFRTISKKIFALLQSSIPIAWRGTFVG